MVRSNRTYSLLNFHRQNYGSFGQNSSKIRSIRLYTLRVSGTCPGRELSGIPANYANSAHFAHTVCESREIHTICSHYTLRFRCLTSGRERHEIPANQAKFTQFAPIFRELREFHALRTKIHAYVINFQISDHRQSERSRNLDRSFRNIYIIPSFPTREQHAHSVQNARSRFTKLNQSYSC